MVILQYPTQPFIYYCYRFHRLRHVGAPMSPSCFTNVTRIAFGPVAAHRRFFDEADRPTPAAVARCRTTCRSIRSYGKVRELAQQPLRQ